MHARDREKSIASPVAMSVGRRIVISGAIMSFVAIGALEIVLQRDDWPFSDFHMYSGKANRRYSRIAVLGVSPDGEFPLEATMTHPISETTLRWSLLRQRKKRGPQVRALEAIKSIYDARRARGLHDGPELHALRLVKRSWGRTRQDLSNRSHAREVPLASAAFISSADQAALEAEARGTAPVPGVEIADGPGLVIDAHAMVLSGRAAVVDDRYAREGKAIVLEGRRYRKAPSRRPEAFAQAELVVPAGRYHIWIRGKVRGGDADGSVWLQIDRQIGTRKHGNGRLGLGHWSRLYPPGAYGWSSTAPGARTTVLELRGGRHRLRLSAREGDVAIDQIWLTQEQFDMPPWTAPVATDTSEP